MKYNKLLIFLAIGLFIICGLIVLFSPEIINSSHWADKWHQNGFKGADNFVSHGYEEIKSISIRFLTLLTAILVFSVTFSEKIVKPEFAKKQTKKILIAGWVCLVAAIILDGLGITLNVYALASALYDQNINEGTSHYLGFTVRALFSMILGGIFFVAGIILIVYAGIISIQNKSTAVEIS